MRKVNFHNKTFKLIENSASGKVNANTLFKYQQVDDMVTADYSGGSVIYGKIIAQFKEDTLEMLYQCLTIDKELKAGKAVADITLTANNKIMLHLNWQWLDSGKKGKSTYIEI